MTAATAGPGTAREVLDGHRRHLNRSMARLLTLLAAPVEVSSAGCHVLDEHGERYLSCGGYGVFLLGHCHPGVVGPVSRQLARRPLATRALADPVAVRAAERLTAAAPAGLDYVLFTSSGTEAVEVGLKLAKAAGRHRLVACHGGYHGKTIGALSVTGRPQYRTPFEPLLPGVEHVPYGDAAALEAALAGGPPAAVVLEPVQAEGGVRLPPAGYLRAVRAACDRHDALLLLDEVQTGLGRLGARWGCDPEQVRPDVLLSGKILGGGVVPVAAALATPAVFEPLNRDPLLHSSTYGGNPLAATAVCATLDVIESEGLVERARVLGERLLPAVRDAVTAGCPDLVREVRGRGLLLGIEFTSASAAVEVMTGLLRRRVLTSYSLNANQVLRLTPPALLSEPDVDWLLTALREAARELGSRRPPADR